MDLGLKGKVALVAGSSQGLGRAIAEQFAAEGASLVLCARGEKMLRRTLDEISRTHQTRAVAVVTDLSEPSQVERLAETARKEMGKVDILVTNTGGPPPGAFADLTSEMWQTAAQSLLFSAVNLTKAVLPGMKKQHWGRIINVTSVAVKQPVENLMLSNSLRAAVTGFARTLANEVASLGITVNNVLPGYTLTRRLDELSADLATRARVEKTEIQKQWISRIPAGRLGEPSELAALVAFLASDQAGYITGSSITVDGGLVGSLL